MTRAVTPFTRRDHPLLSRPVQLALAFAAIAAGTAAGIVLFAHSIPSRPPPLVAYPIAPGPPPGASRRGTTWVAQLARGLGRRPVDHHVPGDTMSATRRVVARTWPVHHRIADGTIVIVALGSADVRRRGLTGLHRFRRGLVAVLARIDTARPRPLVAVVLAPPTGPQAASSSGGRDRLADERRYDAAARAVTRHAGAHVIDPRPGWDAATMSGPRGRRLTSRGEHHLARAAERALSPLVR